MCLFIEFVLSLSLGGGVCVRVYIIIDSSNRLRAPRDASLSLSLSLLLDHRMGKTRSRPRRKGERDETRAQLDVYDVVGGQGGGAETHTQLARRK